MIRFDTQVQQIKHKVLCAVAKLAWEEAPVDEFLEIPKELLPGKTATVRCCIYKERAILGQRVKMAMGGRRADPNVIEVIDIACDGCPAAGYEVTSSCRGCLAHRCEDVCKRGAISFDRNHAAYIDKEKCVECGACAKVCPYFAIVNRKRPCQMSCKMKAISINSDDAAAIDRDLCTECGACVYQCPFGALADKSYILNVIDLIKKHAEDPNGKLYAALAPSFAAQFPDAKLGQIIAGVKKLGFDDVVETAYGADLIVAKEARELAEKGFLISSCCPAFTSYVKKKYPSLAEYISSSLSPMAALAKSIKEKEPDAKVVFIGPCTAKKSEALGDEVSEYVDVVLTFEELRALWDSRNIDITTLEEETLGTASSYGRAFAKSGGVSSAIAHSLVEEGLEFEFKPAVCSGIDECDLMLRKKQRSVLDANFIEGMACVGGCLGGVGCLVREDRSENFDLYVLS